MNWQCTMASETAAGDGVSIAVSGFGNMRQLQETTIGIPWFEEADWVSMQRLQPGEPRIPYQQWYSDMERNVAALEREGFRVMKLRVDAENYRRWCFKRQLVLGNGSWHRYMAELFETRN